MGDLPLDRWDFLAAFLVADWEIERPYVVPLFVSLTALSRASYLCADLLILFVHL